LENLFHCALDVLVLGVVLDDPVDVGGKAFSYLPDLPLQHQVPQSLLEYAQRRFLRKYRERLMDS